MEAGYVFCRHISSSRNIDSAKADYSAFNIKIQMYRKDRYTLVEALPEEGRAFTYCQILAGPDVFVNRFSILFYIVLSLWTRFRLLA